MMRYNTNYTADDYEVGDVIVVKTATTKQAVEVESKEDDIKKGRPGWSGVVVEVIDKAPSAYREEGEEMWGYDNQIVDIR